MILMGEDLYRKTCNFILTFVDTDCFAFWGGIHSAETMEVSGQCPSLEVVTNSYPFYKALNHKRKVSADGGRKMIRNQKLVQARMHDPCTKAKSHGRWPRRLASSF